MSVLFKSFAQSKHTDVISLKNNYRERLSLYVQTGGDFVVDFVFELYPTQIDEVRLKYIPVQGDGDRVVADVARAIEKLLSDLDGMQITLTGIDFVISNCVYHPIDYNPRKTMLHSAARFKTYCWNMPRKKLESPWS